MYKITSVNPKGKRTLRFTHIEDIQEARMWLRWIDRFEPNTQPILHRIKSATYITQHHRHDRVKISRRQIKR
jgi:hypothetical protein